MKQTVLGQPLCAYKKALDRKIFLCAALAVLDLLIHIVLTAMRTEHTHTALLAANIACDTVCGFLLVYQIFRHILPCRRLYALCNREKQSLEGTVTGISALPVRYMDMDCYEVTAAGRRLFLPAHTIGLQEEAHYRLSVVSNIILEAEQ